MGFQPVPAVRENYEYYCEINQSGTIDFFSKNASEACRMMDNLHRSMQEQLTPAEFREWLELQGEIWHWLEAME